MKDLNRFTFIYDKLNREMREKEFHQEELELEITELDNREPSLEYEDATLDDLLCQSYSPCNKCPHSILNDGTCGSNADLDLCMLPLFYSPNFTIC